MIPAAIEAHLRACHGGFEHHLHPTAVTAQRLAAAEHVSGHCVAKPVVVRIGGAPAIAVVSAAQRVNLAALEEATGSRVELVPESESVEWFPACEVGAEPPLAIFGLPIIVDTALALTDRIVMQAGTHDDAVVVDTDRWIDCENVRSIVGLGTPMHPRCARRGAVEGKQGSVAWMPLPDRTRALGTWNGRGLRRILRTRHDQGTAACDGAVRGCPHQVPSGRPLVARRRLER